MTDTVRFGVSLSLELLDRFDLLLRKLGYASRSEAVRDLIRQKLLDEDGESPDTGAFAVVSLVYDGRAADIPSRLVKLQHVSDAEVISSLHVHVDADNCLEIVALKGRCEDVRALGQRLISVKGVKFGDVSIGAAGKHLH